MNHTLLSRYNGLVDFSDAGWRISQHFLHPHRHSWNAVVRKTFFPTRHVPRMGRLLSREYNRSSHVMDNISVLSMFCS